MVYCLQRTTAEDGIFCTILHYCIEYILIILLDPGSEIYVRGMCTLFCNDTGDDSVVTLKPDRFR